MATRTAKRSTNTEPNIGDILFSVNGFDIKKGGIYKVTGKLDKSAPDGFQKEGTTKLPSEGISNLICCKYVVTNDASGKGVYDNGFEINSPCYAGMSKAMREEMVMKLNKYIVEPYESLYGEGDLNPNNVDFWDSYSVPIYDGRVFSADNVTHLLELYIALISNELTPSVDGRPSHEPKYRFSQYCIEDRNKVVSIRKRNVIRKMDTITLFGELLRTDKSRLMSILQYAGMNGANEELDDETLKYLFDDWIESNQDNIHKFNDTYELAKGEGRVELEIHDILQKMFMEGKIRKDKGVFVYNGVPLDSRLTSSAKKISSDPKLVKLKEEILDIEI